MFTDIVVYSALAHQNEALALRVLADQAATIHDCASTHAGREIKTMGDGFLVEFDSALAATQCAIDIQKVITARNHSGDCSPLNPSRKIPSRPSIARPSVGRDLVALQEPPSGGQWDHLGTNACESRHDRVVWPGV
jgi:hypothetical protein